MRRSDIVFGIILILLVPNFALAAPLLIREKPHACVDVVHIPRDMTPVLGKRGDEDLEELAKLMKTYFETGEKPVESSEAHASSSPAPPGPDHGSTVDVKAQEPNPGLAPANPYPVLESSIPSGSGTGWTMPGVHEDDLIGESDDEWPLSSDAQPKPNPGSSAGADSNFDWEYWANAPSPPRKRPAAHENQVGYMQRPNLELSADSDSVWEYWPNKEDQPPLKRPKPVSSKEFGQAHGDQEVDPQQLSEGSSTDSAADMLLQQLKDTMESNPRPLGPGWPGMSSSLAGPSSNLRLSPSLASPELADPELHSDHQSLSTDPQPVDDPAAIYRAKGKAKIPGTVRDVGNAAQGSCSLGEVTKFQKKTIRRGDGDGCGNS